MWACTRMLRTKFLTAAKRMSVGANGGLFIYASLGKYDVWGPPSQMLAAVHGDHLAGHRRGVNQIERRGDHLGELGRLLQGTPAASAWNSSGEWWIEGRMGPGPMALTRMRGANPWAMVRVAVHNAALLRL